MLDGKSILSAKKFKGAKKYDVFECNSIEEIGKLSKEKFHNLGAMFIPTPFLRTAILNRESKVPAEIILMANKAATA